MPETTPATVPDVLVVSDVHGAFDDLARVIGTGEVVLVLGDLINLMDYRTGEGIIADVLGVEFARAAAELRAKGDYPALRELWRAEVGDRFTSVREAIDRRAEDEYAACRRALAGGTGYVTYGNVDRPDLLARSLPDGMRFVDGTVVELEGLRFGFVGGGVATPVGADGEVTDEEMFEKLAAIGEVDVLCSHLPPAVTPLHVDVVTGRAERSSRPILEYLLDVQPRFHFFGDVHQPQATHWRVGRTRCRNVGYFRATRRPVEFHPDRL
jgi:Icc-related predicted phosphoesterase